MVRSAELVRQAEEAADAANERARDDAWDAARLMRQLQERLNPSHVRNLIN